MGSARRSELAGRFQPSDALSELTRLADFVHRRLSAARAGVEGRGRKLGLEQRPHPIVAADDRVPRPGALLLEAMHDVPESPALSPLRVRTRRIVEFDAAQEGVQVDLFLRDNAEGLDPRHETGLSSLVRSHPREFLDVPAGDVHEDRLRGVVEVQARGNVIRIDLTGRAVEGLPTERPAVAARDRFWIHDDDIVHRVPNVVRIGQEAVLDSESGAEPPRVVDSLGTVRCDPLVDRDPDEFDVASVLEELREERRRRARVLPAAHPDRDPLSAAEVDLGSELALHPPLDEIEEMRAAQMLPVVPEPLDGRGATSVARHSRSNRRGGLRPHGPGGGDGPEGGCRGCDAPAGGATAEPGNNGGGPKVHCRTIKSYATPAKITDNDPTSPDAIAAAANVGTGPGIRAAGSVMAKVMARRRIPTTKRAPKRDHQ